VICGRILKSRWMGRPFTEMAGSFRSNGDL
jgi:hypothetical protein